MDDDRPLLTAFDASSRIEHFLAIGQFDRARELAAQYIAADPNNTSAYIALSRILLHEDDRTAAIVPAQRAVEIDPESPAAWYILSVALYNAGRFAESEKSVIEAVRLDPEFPPSHLLHARILSNCGRGAAALESVRVALELDPDDEDAHRLFARLLNEVRPREWRLSEDFARRAVSLNPEDGESHAILGYILLTTGRTDEAEQRFTTALELDPMNALAVEGLAQVMMAKNPAYRPFLWYALTMRRLGQGAQLLVVASLWVLVSVALAIMKTGPASTAVLVTYLALCAYTWFAAPITRAILRRRYSWI